MSKFFNALKSAIFEEIPANNQQPQPVQQPAIPVQQPQPAAAPVQQPAIPVQQAAQAAPQAPALNAELLDKLCTRLEAENLPGPDYYELRSAVSDPVMTEAIPDEGKRFLIAYKTLKAGAPSLKKETVLKSIDHYTSCLRGWEKEALDEVEKNMDTLKSDKDKILEMQAQVEELNKKITDMQANVAISEVKWTKNRTDMESAIEFLVGKLAQDGEKIKQFIND